MYLIFLFHRGFAPLESSGIRLTSSRWRDTGVFLRYSLETRSSFHPLLILCYVRAAQSKLFISMPYNRSCVTSVSPTAWRTEYVYVYALKKAGRGEARKYETASQPSQPIIMHGDASRRYVDTNLNLNIPRVAADRDNGGLA